MMIIVIRKCLAMSHHAVECCSLLSWEAIAEQLPPTDPSAEKACWQQLEEARLFLSPFDIHIFSRSSVAPERSAPPSNPSVRDYRNLPGHPTPTLEAWEISGYHQHCQFFRKDLDEAFLLTGD